MIRKGTDEDFEEIFNIINDAAKAYKGVIPPDRWHRGACRWIGPKLQYKRLNAASLASQGHNRIDPRGPPCGNVTRHQRHYRE